MAESISSMVAWKLRKAIAGTASKDAPRSGTATVQRRDSNGTVWVRLPGASMDTPVVGSVVASVAAGDTISYEIQGGRVNVTGNASDPAASERAVDAVRKAANAARELARDAKAIAEATGQYFWHDDSGAHVSTEKDNPAGPQNTIWNSLGMLFRSGTTNLLAIVAGADSGMDVYDGQGNEDENVIASHRGSGTRIGRSSESHMELDYHSMRMIDRDGDTYLHVSDLRDEDGYATLTERFTVNTEYDNRTFTLMYVPEDDGILVTVNGNSVEFGRGSSYRPKDIIVYVRLYIDDSVVITYKTASDEVKAFTFGSRDPLSTIGPISYAEGKNVTADNVCTHAEGCDTAAKGQYDHAEGYGSIAHGYASHAQNYNTRASGIYQTAMGRYNVEDVGYLYALIVGNGTADDARSNAFAVTWEGDLEYQGTLNGMTWHGDTYGTASGGSTALPAEGTYILVTGHNSTPALNGIWIVRTGGNTAFRLAGGGNVTITVSGTLVTVTTTSGTVNVYYQYCGI